MGVTAVVAVVFFQSKIVEEHVKISTGVSVQHAVFAVL